MTNCTDTFPTTQELFEDLRKDTGTLVLTAICGVLTLVTIALFVESLHFIIKHYTLKEQKTKIIALLALFPIVSSSCMIGLTVPRSMILTELLSAIYLSFCLLIFVRLILEYYGGENTLLSVLSGEPFTYRTPPFCCCCFCCRPTVVTKRNVLIAKICVVQVAVVRPTVLFIRAVMWSNGSFQLGENLEPKMFSFYLTLLNTVSTLLAMYGLILIYRNTSHTLKKYRIRFKFVCLQLSFVLLNLQSSILVLLARNNIPECKGVRGSILRGYRIHYFLLIMEFFLLSILARYAYKQHEEQCSLERIGVETRPLQDELVRQSQTIKLQPMLR